MEFEDLSAVNETEISVFSHAKDNIPSSFTLEKWLLNTIKPVDIELRNLVLKYRETFDADLKKQLPACTISASFNGVRNLNNIKKKNRLICIDIDRYSKSKKKKCNECIDMLLVKEMFMNHPCTLYVGKSVSGDGIYAIIRISDAERLEDYFNYFESKLSRIGINIDQVCKDYTRLRFYSFDPEAYLNLDAIYLKLPKKEVEVKPIRKSYITLEDEVKVEKIIKFLDEHSMDITQSYEDWFKIGAALYDGFGDMGESYFHQISSHYPDYNAAKTKEKWKQCRKLNQIKLSSLFFVASSYGVRY